MTPAARRTHTPPAAPPPLTTPADDMPTFDRDLLELVGRHTGLDADQLRLLHALTGHPSTVRQLATVLDQPPKTVAQTVTNLCDAGLVREIADPATDVPRITLTEPGRVRADQLTAFQLRRTIATT